LLGGRVEFVSRLAVVYVKAVGGVLIKQGILLSDMCSGGVCPIHSSCACSTDSALIVASMKPPVII
jgi:hypothetical protein